MQKLIVTCSAFLLFFQSQAQINIDVESGLAISSYNNIKIPNHTGTTFNFNSDFYPQSPVIPLFLEGDGLAGGHGRE